MIIISDGINQSISGAMEHHTCCKCKQFGFDIDGDDRDQLLAPISDRHDRIEAPHSEQPNLLSDSLRLMLLQLLRLHLPLFCLLMLHLLLYNYSVCYCWFHCCWLCYFCCVHCCVWWFGVFYFCYHFRLSEKAFSHKNSKVNGYLLLELSTKTV